MFVMNNSVANISFFNKNRSIVTAKDVNLQKY